MPDGQRLWRTQKGDLVPDGHPEALTLAYGTDDDLAAGDKGNVRGSGRGHTPKASADPTPKKRSSAKPKAAE